MAKQVAYDQVDNTPVPKMQAAGIAGSITVVLIFILGQIDFEVPPEVASAVTVIISFLAGYFRRDEKPVEVVQVLKEKEL